jgi:UDP-N-acetylglucosamine acyltransferase
MPIIHPMSAVDPKARIADDVEIGPFCVVGPDVEIGPGCKLITHVTLVGHTRVGSGNVFFPNCAAGVAPQDKKYKGGSTHLEIGNNNNIRENVTIHAGTEKGGGLTRIGSGNLLMVNAHIAHDVILGDNCIIGNNVMIAGHVEVRNYVAMMGGVGIHHFVTVGDFAYLGGYAKIHHDVPPFVKVDGSDTVRGLNATGLRRAGFVESDIDALEAACRRLFYKEKPFAVALAEFDCENGINPHVKTMIEFLRRRDAGKNGRYLEAKRAK